MWLGKNNLARGSIIDSTYRTICLSWKSVLAFSAFSDFPIGMHSVKAMLVLTNGLNNYFF